VVDAGDTVIERAGTGNDSVYVNEAGADLQGEIERIPLHYAASGNVSGTETDNKIRGSSKDNTLRGGGGGDDTLCGGRRAVGGDGAKDRLEGATATTATTSRAGIRWWRRRAAATTPCW
jgi:hypothetical protein